MAGPSFLDTASGRRLAYHRTTGAEPGVVFLHGFQSDMEGTKALALEQWARTQGRAFLRFDYSGHGQSAGAFTDGCIGDWAEDAAAAIGALTDGPQIVVGSSMGGWIACLLARRMPERFAAFIGIAAAPDFTEDRLWAAFPPEMRRQVMQEGRVDVPSDYGDPYPITRRLIEDGRTHLVLRRPLRFSVPVRLLQGTEDEAVPQEVALKLLDHIEAEDLRLTLVKGADHRFSGPEEIGLILRTLDGVLGQSV